MLWPETADANSNHRHRTRLHGTLADKYGRQARLDGGVPRTAGPSPTAWPTHAHLMDWQIALMSSWCIGCRHCLLPLAVATCCCCHWPLPLTAAISCLPTTVLVFGWVRHCFLAPSLLPLGCLATTLFITRQTARRTSCTCCLHIIVAHPLFE